MTKSNEKHEKAKLVRCGFLTKKHLGYSLLFQVITFTFRVPTVSESILCARIHLFVVILESGT